MNIFNTNKKIDSYGNPVESRRRITPKKAVAGLAALVVGATGGYHLTEPGNAGTKDPFGEGSGVTQPVHEAEVPDNLYENPVVTLPSTPEAPAVETARPGEGISSIVERHLDATTEGPVSPATVDAVTDQIVEERGTPDIEEGEKLIIHER